MTLDPVDLQTTVKRAPEDRRKMDCGSPTGSDRRISLRDRRGYNNILFVTFKLNGELLGIPVEQVQEVLDQKDISSIPKAPSEVIGLLNLRGQVVTGIDLRTRLGLPLRDAGLPWMNVVVKDKSELFSLIVDEVGEVVEVRKDLLIQAPATLDITWKNICQGVVKFSNNILIILDVSMLLNT